MSFHCGVCGARHQGLPDIALRLPDPVAELGAEERAARVRQHADRCVLDDEDYFVRGVLLIPVHDYDQDFGFGVWVSHKRQNFELYERSPDAVIGPFFGWLSNEVPGFPGSFCLKTVAHYPGGRQRPRIELEPTPHPLAVAQRDGIALQRLLEIVHRYLQRQPG